MKQATLKLTALVMLLAGATTNVEAQSGTGVRNPSVVTTAVPFLRISPDARSAGMGDVGIATSPDAYSIFWNNAKTPFATSKFMIGATYTPWLSDLDLKDVYIATLAGYYKLDDNQAISASLKYFSLGSIQFTNEQGQNLNQERPREFAFDAGYSRKLGTKSGIGVTLRYINSNLAGGTVNNINYKTGTSVAGDLHFYHQGTNATTGNGFNWGATLSNLGAKISYTDDKSQQDFIPANLGLGASYTKAFDADSKLTIALDVNKLLVPTPPTQADIETDSSFQIRVREYRDKGVVSSWFSSFGDSEDSELKELTIALGAEFWYKSQFAIRAGYFYENPDKGNRKYFTIGAGLIYNTIGINLSYLLPSGSTINRNPLSNTVRFGLSFDLDKK
jgi:hypothetical protein